MLTKFRKPILTGLIIVLGTSLLALAMVLFTASPAPAAPKITWTPSSVTDTILAGGSKTVPVSFTASQDLSHVVVRVVPELEPYIQANPAGFASISKGQTVNLDLIISAPASSLPGAFEGTIQLRSGDNPSRAFARPLPISIEIIDPTAGWPTFTSEDSVYEVKYPPNWIVREEQGAVVFSNVLEASPISDAALQTESFFKIRVRSQENQDLLPISEWFDDFFSGGFAVEAHSRNSLLVDGHDAILIETSEIGRRVHIYILNGSDVVEITYGLFAPDFVDEYVAMLNSFQFSQ